MKPGFGEWQRIDDYGNDICPSLAHAVGERCQDSRARRPSLVLDRGWVELVEHVYTPYMYISLLTTWYNG